MAKSFSKLRNKLPKASRKRAEKKAIKMIKKMPLSTLRKALSISQVELARRLKSAQPHVSKLERRSDMCISTLKSYIEGLGGELELKARFPKNREVKIDLGTSSNKFV